MNVESLDARSLDATRSAWDAIADGYDEHVTPTGRWALPEEALHRVGLRAGMRVLDVASGSGALTLPAARRGARVTAVDLSPAMIHRLEARVRAEGLAGVDGRVMDGHALAFDDGTFDIAGSQFGVMLFPDLPRALREMVRVTRPGGRVLMVAYGPPDEVEFLGFFLSALRAVMPELPGLPTDPPPLPFQAADPERLRHAMADAGLRGVRVDRSTERVEFGSGADMWRWVTSSNPIPAQLVADLDGEERARVQQVLDGMLRERSGGRPGGVLHARVHIAIGRK